MRKVNGIDPDALHDTVRRFRDTPSDAAFTFQTRTDWIGGGQSRTTIGTFTGAGAEQNGRGFVLDADEPHVLLGTDAAPNPVEHLLHALAACLTGSLAYHAAARGIAIRSCECTLRGELDIRGFLGVTPGVRRGFQRIEADFLVDSDATPEQLIELVRYSPVLDVVSSGTEVALKVEAVAPVLTPA